MAKDENAGNSGQPAAGESVANDPAKTGVPATRQTSDATATGQEIAARMGHEKIPKGKDRGSKVPIEGQPKADLIGKGGKPSELQKPGSALFVSNGSIDPTTVPSPTGLQPVGAVATSPEHAKELIKQRREDHERYVERGAESKNAGKRLDEATINRLSKVELRAIGSQRGYAMGEGGTRTTRAAFVAGQDADESLGGKVGKNSRGQGSSQQARGAKANKGSMQRATKQAAPKKSSEVNSGRKTGRGSR